MGTGSSSAMQTCDGVTEGAKHAAYAQEAERIARSMLTSGESSKQPIKLTKLAPADPDYYIPSPHCFKEIVPPPACKGFQRYKHTPAYSGKGKILITCTSSYNLPLQDGVSFYTGNHTTELLVPMIAFADAGFGFVVATIDGNPVRVEEWTFPLAGEYEEEIRAIYQANRQLFDAPRKTSEVDIEADNIIAIFGPGGHGAMSQAHKDPALGSLLRKAHERELPTIMLCHGTHILAAAALGGEFPYKGYKCLCFFDAMDEPVLQQLGYPPAKMTLLPQKSLIELGMAVLNTKGDEAWDDVCVDRELITGTSQQSAQKLGEQAVKTLMEKHAPGSVRGDLPLEKHGQGRA
uniref:DJ-1/PfpI domain-containing protein n=1 Tax=Alexandrium catenella TaxID=2925 RepID=A0A7S1QQT5_ALECA